MVAEDERDRWDESVGRNAGEPARRTGDNDRPPAPKSRAAPGQLMSPATTPGSEITQGGEGVRRLGSVVTAGGRGA